MPPPAPKAEEENEDWLTTYADAITLLMAFFVLLVSFSKVDLEIYDEVASGLSDAIAREERKSEAETIKEAVQEAIVNGGASDVAKMGTDAEGSITIELGGGAFFRPGSAVLLEQAVPFIRQMYQEVSAPIYSTFNVTVEGHTDDDPISTPQFPSNWELSSNRASTIVRFFESEGMKANRLKAIGFAHTQPKVPNRDEAGNPIPDNQLANRRVVIRLNRKPVYNAIKIPRFRRSKGSSKEIN